MVRAKEVGEGSMPAPHYPGALVKMVRGAWERAACRPTLPRSALKMVWGHLGPSFAGSTPTPASSPQQSACTALASLFLTHGRQVGAQPALPHCLPLERLPSHSQTHNLPPG